jgi:hypothetical protein
MAKYLFKANIFAKLSEIVEADSENEAWNKIKNQKSFEIKQKAGLRKEKVTIETIKQYVWGLKNLKKEFGYVLTDLPCSTDCRVEALIAITEYLGFTIERVYEAYCDKNKINYQRLKEGY